MSSEKKCCVPGCSGNSDSNTVLHLFPNPVKDMDRFMSWVFTIGGDILKFSNEYIYKNRRVCHAHFELEYCCRYNRISNIAVPTLNMPGTENNIISDNNMGNKRKHREEEESRITKKIKKLERKLQRRRRVISSDDSNSEIEEQVLPVMSPRSSPTYHGASPLNHGIEFLDMPSLISPLPQTSLHESASLQHNTNAEAVIPKLGPSSASEPCSANVQEEDTQIEDDILQILGEPPQPEIALGKNIHKDIASRWEDILIKGLPREIKEPLLKKYLIPANCNLLVAPLLNPEAKAATPDILARRDDTLLQKQNQIGVALAALSQLTEMILRNETSKQNLLQPLSDACRILCDSHCIEGRTRRSIIMSSINTSLRDALANTNRDKYLFGQDLAEQLKAAKFVQKTGESLQKTNPVASTSRSSSNFRGTSRNQNLNFRGPISRKPPVKTSDSSRGRQPARQMRGFNYSRQPPPPPKKSSPTRKNYRR